MRTFSTRERWRTISPYTQGIGLNFPGQSVFSCGHAIQVASWRSHSAGIRNPCSAGASVTSVIASVQPAFCDRAIRIDAPVAEKRPVSTHLVHPLRIALHDQNLFPIRRCLRYDLPERIGHERVAPEFKPVVLWALETDAIDGGNVNTVRNCVCALDCPPRIQLGSAVLRFFGRVPANCRGVKENVRPLQTGQPGSLGVPLIPAHQYTDASVLRFEVFEAEVSRCEV